MTNDTTELRKQWYRMPCDTAGGVIHDLCDELDKLRSAGRCVAALRKLMLSFDENAGEVRIPNYIVEECRAALAEVSK